jgi:hypothetical protein
MMNKQKSIKINKDKFDYSNIPHHEEFKTGDILLFSGKDYFPSKCIEDLTHSKYSHVGIILRDPVLDGSEYKGLFIFESTDWIDVDDVEDHKIKSGVQVNELSKIYNEPDGDIYWRRLNTDRDDDFYKIMRNIHKTTYDKDYDFDPMDWIKAYFDIDYNDQKTYEFICSALVAYTYDQLNLLVKPVEWTIVRPKDLGTEDPPDKRRVQLINCTLDKEICIKIDKTDKCSKSDNQTKTNIELSGSRYYLSYVYTPISIVTNLIKKYTYRNTT